MTLQEIFEQAREMLGGSEEAELIYRYPDQRLWKFYNREFKRFLSTKVTLADTSLLGVASGAAGEAEVELGPGDRSVRMVRFTSGTADDVVLDMTSMQALAEMGYDENASGVVEACYLRSVDGVVSLVLWRVPEEAWSAVIYGNGLPTEEEVEFNTSTKMLEEDLDATIPDQFFQSAVMFLAWKMKQSMEEYIKNPSVVAGAEEAFTRQFLRDLGDYNSTLTRTSTRTRGGTLRRWRK